MKRKFYHAGGSQPTKAISSIANWFQWLPSDHQSVPNSLECLQGIQLNLPLPYWLQVNHISRKGWTYCQFLSLLGGRSQDDCKCYAFHLFKVANSAFQVEFAPPSYCHLFDRQYTLAGEFWTLHPAENNLLISIHSSTSCHTDAKPVGSFTVRGNSFTTMKVIARNSKSYLTGNGIPWGRLRRIPKKEGSNVLPKTYFWGTTTLSTVSWSAWRRSEHLLMGEGPVGFSWNFRLGHGGFCVHASLLKSYLPGLPTQ